MAWRHSLFISPLVERELLAGSRRKALFWPRGGLALVAGFQAWEMLNRSAGPGGAAVAGVSGAAVLRQMAGLLFMVSLLMGLLSANSINRERREGTLGLLLLTGLSPAQIVRGKMLSCGLTSFMVLLGALPAVMLPVLIGGTRGSEVVIIGLGVLNALFVSLAAGLWMSAVFRQQRYAVLATILLVTALAFGAELLGVAISGSGAVAVLRLLGLGGWISATHATHPLALIYVAWLVLAHAVGWLLLYLAAWSLARNWRDEALRHRRQPAPPEPWASPYPPGSASDPLADALAPAGALALPDPPPWDADPIRWRMDKIGSPQALLWLAVLADFLAQFGLVGHNTTFSVSWGLLSFGGILATVLSSSLLAWAGARFFQQTARQQDLELLLTTPVGAANILSGQWQRLRRALRGPLSVVLAFSLPAGICLVFDGLVAHRTDTLADLLPPFLIGVNLVVEVLALCWVGMRFGLRARNMASAVLWTIGWVQLLPLALVIAASWGWTAWTGLAARGSIPLVVPGLLFFLAKNVFFLTWAPVRMRRELRLGTRAQRTPRRNHRLVPQPG